VLPHLDAACNFARWLARSAADADDIVQEALLHASAVSTDSGAQTPNPGCSPSSGTAF
jgi:DNA-directed RNA polymerase specialized sigma24 family protein